ncbi:30S ribosomal protein S9 [Candidatus Bathyarchaeota archaeon]|mgnify:CR=1 FL=1|nr:MAG: 30S ribosomal protein S9 [Candidatus Bathyarchaeota archaeon]
MSKRVKLIHVSARRKTSVARVTVREGKGRIRVNNKPLELLSPALVRDKILEPLLLAGDEIRKRLDIKVKVQGGGIMSQADAARMAIARALVSWTRSKTLRNLFLSYDRSMLAGDPRQKEPKKFGGPGARRRRQKSYR